MKHMKKFMALFAALALVLAMAVPAFAADGSGNYTISVKADDTHTYEVYQIFTGDLHEGVLSNVKWGKNGINDGTTVTEGEAVPQTVLNAIVAKKGGTDAEKLTEIEKYVNLNSEKFGTVSASSPLTAPAGYYLIKDTDGSYDEQHGAHTQYIVTVVNDVTVNPKTGYPTVEKKVKENVKYNQDGGYGEHYNDTADYNIGDAVPFKLIGTIPDMSAYTSYKYTFHDTLSNSLNAPNKAAVKIYLASDKSGSDAVDVTSNFTVTVSGQDIDIHTDDLKTVVSGYNGKSFVIVEYEAVLNDNASIAGATPGNINKVYLTYSNNPHDGGTGEKGKTPEDQVIVFTYELNVKKIDGDNQKPLQGVTFKLYKDVNGAKKWATVDPTTSKLTGWVDDETAASVLTSDSEGKFKVIGLDDGTYYIHEVAALPNYNSIDDVEIKISANTNNGQNKTGNVTDLGTITVSTVAGGTTTPATGNEVTIENRMGTTLPGTGGIGTTIFYVVGGGLMVAAVVLLVAKKRMENK